MKRTIAPLAMTQADLTQFLATSFEQVADQLDIRSTDPLTLRLLVGRAHLRPGGTVSGPAMFLLADVAAYLAILAQIGVRPLAVTTSAQMDFLRKPAAGDLDAVAELLKLGKRLAVVETRLYSAGHPDLVARASLTYALPPERL